MALIRIQAANAAFWNTFVCIFLHLRGRSWQMQWRTQPGITHSVNITKQDTGPLLPLIVNIIPFHRGWFLRYLAVQLSEEEENHIMPL